MNAPLDSNLHVHVIADMDASNAAHDIVQKAQLTKSVWRNKVTITVTNVESKLEEWTTFLRNHLAKEGTGDGWYDSRIGIGGYFRLLAHRIIMLDGEYSSISEFDERDLAQAVYMDTGGAEKVIKR